jgi:hypothetical protein
MKTAYLFIMIILFLLFTDQSHSENNIECTKIRYEYYDVQKMDWTEEFDAPEHYEFFDYDFRVVGYFKNMTEDKWLQFQVGYEIYDVYRQKRVAYKKESVEDENLIEGSFYWIMYCDEDGNELDYPVEGKAGIPPGGYAKVIFHLPVQLPLPNHEMKLKVFSTGLSMPESEPFTDEDFSDDTLSKSLITVPKIELLSGYDHKYTEYNGMKYPDLTNWYSRGVEVVDGNEFCYFPHSSFHYENIDGKDSIELRYAPVYRMNRLDINGNDIPEGTEGGDYMLSSILDYRNKRGVFFNLFLQRLGKLYDKFDRKWSYDKLWGPEHRVVNNLSDTIALRDGDKLIVDIVCSRDIYSLLNVAEEDWNQIPDNKLKQRVKANPAMTVFGGGGYAIAIDENNNDSILYNSQGLRRDPFDDGKDQSFKLYSFNLPDTLVHDNIGFLRLRVRVVAKNDRETRIVEDDADDFFVEGIGETLLCGCGEIYTNSITINNKYSVVPQEHAVFPISMELTNTANSFPQFYAIAKIKLKDESNWQWSDTTIITHMQRLEKETVDFRKLDLSYYKGIKIKGIKKGRNDFQAIGYTYIYGGDHIIQNDSVYTEFSVNIGDVIAYDDDEAKSEVGEMFYIPDRGLNLCGHSSAEYTQTTACGEAGGDCMGMYAMKFRLARKDTLYGASGCFMPSNFSPDEISYILYKDTVINSAHLPGQLLSNSEIKTVRGIDNIRKDLYFGEYVTCLFDEPIIIEYPGIYWLAIKQKAQSGLELGGSGQGMGIITTSYSSFTDSEPISLMLDRKYRFNLYGSLFNDNVFAYRNDTSETAEWQPFMPNFGYPAYGFLDSAGTKENIKTYSRGTWILMIRPYFNGDHYNWNSVSENDIAENISIYPNPVKDYLILQYPENDSNEPMIRIMDINGRELYLQIHQYFDWALIDTKNLNTGMYLIKVQRGEKITVSKFIKE